MEYFSGLLTWESLAAGIILAIGIRIFVTNFKANTLASIFEWILNLLHR